MPNLPRKPRYAEKHKKRDLMVRPDRTANARRADPRERFYVNNAGERFLARTEMERDYEYSVSISQWEFEKRGEWFPVGLGQIVDAGNFIYLWEIDKAATLLEGGSVGGGKPKEEFKHRFLFRIFLDEALRIAKRKGIEEIKIRARTEGFRDYLEREFGFSFESNPDERGWWYGSLYARKEK